jgi:hypothetical protein
MTFRSPSFHRLEAWADKMNAFFSKDIFLIFNFRIYLSSQSNLNQRVVVCVFFGESFFGETDQLLTKISSREIPDTRWEFTADTVMSLAVLEELEENGAIDQDRLIKKFCKNHDLDPKRGYGATLRRLLREIKDGENWSKVSKQAFDGQGSMGNGAAMRVCPIGAYYSDDIQKVKAFAAKSSDTFKYRSYDTKKWILQLPLSRKSLIFKSINLF